MSRDVENLIDHLSAELKPVSVLAHPLRRALPWLLMASVYMTGVLLFLGLRPDLAEKLTQGAYLFEISVTGFVAISAALASAWLCVPDMRGQKWLPAVPLAALAVFLIWTGVMSMLDGVHMPSPYWDHCFNIGALMGFVPMVAMIFLARNGATTRPVTMSLMNTLSVGALGYVGLRFVCPTDTIGHVFFYHLFTFMLLGLFAGLAARKLYRW